MVLLEAAAQIAGASTIDSSKRHKAQMHLICCFGEHTTERSARPRAADLSLQDHQCAGGAVHQLPPPSSCSGATPLLRLLTGSTSAYPLAAHLGVGLERGSTPTSVNLAYPRAAKTFNKKL